MTDKFNPHTKEIRSGNLGKAFRQAPWVDATPQQSFQYRLQEAKDNKRSEINIVTNTALYQHITYNGHDFIVSEKAASNILGAIILNQPSYNWRDIDRNLIIITVADLKNLAGLIAQQRSLVYNNEAVKLDEIEAADTITKVNNIIW
jgi:hypothetical protein